MGPDAQIVAFYVMTCPSSNMIGLYYLPLPTLCHETGISEEGALKALRRVSEGGFCHYSEADEVVYVPNMAREQIGPELKPDDNRVKGIIRELEQHRKSPFYEAFFAKYGKAYHLGECKPLASPFEGPSKPLARGADKEKEKEKDKEREKEELTVAPAPAPLFLAPAASEPPRIAPAEAVATLAQHSGGRFVASRLAKGQAINLARLCKALPEDEQWRLVGEWLAAGGDAWRGVLDVRALKDAEVWHAQAAAWDTAGRPPIATSGRKVTAPSSLDEDIANLRRMGI